MFIKNLFYLYSGFYKTLFRHIVFMFFNILLQRYDVYVYG